MAKKLNKEGKRVKVTAVQATPAVKVIPVDPRDLKDLYYLDEMVKDLHESFRAPFGGGYKWATFLRDWYHELMKKVNHTDAEREDYLIQSFGLEFYNEGNFLTIEEREQFLANEL